MVHYNIHHFAMTMFIEELRNRSGDELADFIAMAKNYNKLQKWFDDQLEEMSMDTYVKCCIAGTIYDEFYNIFKSIQEKL